MGLSVFMFFFGPFVRHNFAAIRPSSKAVCRDLVGRLRTSPMTEHELSSVL